MAKLLGQHFSTALAGLAGEHKHREFFYSVAVAVGHDQLALGKRATTLAILTQFEKVLMLCICRYWATTSHYFFHVK